LTEAGYQVLPCTRPKAAIELARKEKPSLILFDFMMPEMDGMLLCRILKEFPETAHIPIIFLASADEADQCVEAFAAGAVDYITKPFKPAQLLARVRTHLELKAARDRLAIVSEEKTNLMRMVAHDLKNPLTALILSLGLIRDPQNRYNSLIDKVLETVDIHTGRMTTLIGSLLKEKALQQGKIDFKMEKVVVNGLVTEAAKTYQAPCDLKKIELVLNIENTPVTCLVDRDAFVQIVDNLVSNAIKFSPPGKTVRVNLGCLGDVNRLMVEDEGPGILAEEKNLLFNAFSNLSAKPTAGENSTGVGLSVVKRLVESMQGRVWCESLMGQGSTFIVEFPTVR
jgi:two-component system, sensor histidine kinase and response regulator